jgi:23S rRNA (guanine745-N1)-methyltransferase
MPALLCPVRRCRAPLAREREAGPLACLRGHSFDVARSGYVNLLQPQDRRSKHPGDSRDAALARRRAADAGQEAGMLEEVLRELDALARSSDRPLAVLDVGCGEGSLLRALAAARKIEAHGIDISAPAIELAAKRGSGPTWVVANADRLLPWGDAAFDLVLSITSRRNGSEFRRVLAPDGHVVIAVPAEDDLIELREALLGEGARKDRAGSVARDLRPFLELVSRRATRRRVTLDEPAVRDLLEATYRGARTSQRDRVAGIGALEVTMSREILVFRSSGHPMLGSPV